ncbi:aspartyl aminopeptidase [Toxoplasma gondii ME49]|uniref:aspartyl aminopeptidase n=20 Tax=Toxoplasma gondii TaxID=5811 RepID=A0A125YW20_TOXGV|nr:aspartyl aminopeptidase [Toxoplasma gondii ME49]EPR58331.1 aspartyl aminopeptidase [Toxoplasma gondii GT1]ESS29890.1 aspartyl aminopeptidase [Toxoplasma gondii VEG]KAF4645788.1 aspartyl aminopeptidase [Toxoplasma gondii]KFG30137.1 aspartyl aminopeptidase [Toxoplasma gondii p89]KFG42024.1 aspartyl aminopeptidase [Toxoplasma gondii GAB2-2007-GAL-DOM2]KFH01053.1 aspartyl aminopeptidase [Toxoplasma gondii VAND]KYF42403.1 aspartyl aminopeptidase [Toxoplasma gondii ARI]PIL99100.1 aspartyl amin|eukprot:XP_002371216.2 aspartyl aminopeptidase [Toxoplasma gondii ME49]
MQMQTGTELDLLTNMLGTSSAVAAALLEGGRRYGANFLSFVNETGSPYHSVLAVQQRLIACGFSQLDERDKWDLRLGGKYFVTRNHSCIAAFVIGEKFKATSGGFTVVAAHTDSPCLRLRPNSNVKKEGVQQVGVECYGGGLWHTWFDRGLGVAGKVVVKAQDGSLAEKLIRVDRPILVLPNLAIHLQSAEEISAFKINKETHLQPVLCTEVYTQLLAANDSTAREEKRTEEADKETEGNSSCSHLRKRQGERAAAPLLSLIAQELRVENEDIVEWDLCLMDATPGRFCGVHEEFVESPRLDNLGSTWAAFSALMECPSPHPEEISMAVGFDHEEIGSESYTGAGSNVLMVWMERVAQALSAAEFYPQILSRSFLVSSDMAHGVHPNYAERHQGQNKPQMQQGVVIKENANQRYATNATSMALTRAVAEKGQVPMQMFTVKNDSRCGSTVGPILSARLGVRTIDIGIPQWAMHSCRETCGILDLYALQLLLKEFFASFRSIDNSYKGM